jgi:hypothetical protein
MTAVPDPAPRSSALGSGLWAPGRVWPKAQSLEPGAYFVSLCPVCFLQYLQYLLNSRRSDDFLRFFVVL